MLASFGVIREVAGVVAQAGAETLPSLRDGRIQQEPAFTDRMLGRIEHAVEGYESKGIVWQAKTFTDRGPGAQERRTGADFMGVLHINLEGFAVRKGFLAQAKIVDDWSTMPNAEFLRMQDQCRTMLGITPASFIFVYSTWSIYVLPAVSVAGVTKAQIGNLYTRSMARFYEEHFASFIGDSRLSMPRMEALEALVRDFRTPAALALAASQVPTEKS